MKTRFAVLFLTVSLLFSGCIQPYTPPGGDTKPVPVVVVTPNQAFDTYKLDTASNFRSLAQRCADGDFEYVSEFVDAAKELDKAAKIKRSQVIDKIVAEALGTEELDKAKAVEVLLKIADDLDPKHKIEIVLPKQEPAPAPPVKTGKVAALSE